MKDSQSLNKLETCELAGITFIRDYIQLLFDGPYLSGYVWPVLRLDQKTFIFNSAGYRDALCEQIGKIVTKVILDEKESLVIKFSDDSEIKFSLKDEDKISPDSVLINLDGYTWVW